MNVYQLRMLPECQITDAGSYQETWDLAAKPSSLHATRSGAKRKAAEMLIEFTDYIDEDGGVVEWGEYENGSLAGSFESITGTITFLITRTAVE